jgi:hypothetical protein
VADPPTTLAEAREAARQLGGANAQVVHDYLRQQAAGGDWRAVAERLATELDYSMDELAMHYPDEEMTVFAWFNDGTAALNEFNAAVARADQK